MGLSSQKIHRHGQNLQVFWESDLGVGVTQHVESRYFESSENCLHFHVLMI